MGLLVGGVFEVEPGDLLIPHLYDWSFSGLPSVYVSVPSFTFPQVFTVAFSVKAYPRIPSGFEWAFIHNYPDVWYGAMSLTVEYDLRGVFRIQGEDGNQYWISWGPFYDEGVFTHVAVQHNGSAMRMFKNGVLVSERSVPVLPPLRTDELRIFAHGGGGMHINMVASFFLVHSNALSDSKIQQVYSDGVVDASGLALLLDATFWDGSRFIDLSGNGNHGYPYGGVQRVPAGHRYVLRVKGRFSDGVPRLAVPGRCTYMTNCSWRENWSDSPLFVELQPGRNLILVETLD